VAQASPDLVIALQQLARIEDALRVGRALQAPYEVERDWILHAREKIALHHADAVLGRGRALNVRFYLETVSELT
jgi:hypothetical protein